MVLTGGSFAQVDRMLVDGSDRQALFTGHGRWFSADQITARLAQIADRYDHQ